MSEQLAVFLIPLCTTASVYLFVVSLLRPKSRLAERLEKLRPRSMKRRDAGISGFLSHALSEEQRSRLSTRLQEAGWYGTSPTNIVLRSALGSAAGALAAFVLVSFLRPQAAAAALLVAALSVAGGYAPFRQLDYAIENRKREINRSLPNFLDLVATMVRAGLSLNAAMAKAVDAAQKALKEEIAAALSEIRLGRSRAEALTAMSERVHQADLTNAVTAIVQAERLGTNISDVLERAADEARNDRLRRAEEEAAKLPIKIAFPMAFFMLPAAYVVIFTAVIANLTDNP